MISFSLSLAKVEDADKDNENDSLSLSVHSLPGVSFLKEPLNPTSQYFDPREYMCGWGAAFINITVTYPIYKLIFRQMLHNLEALGAYKELKREGFQYLYRGMLPPLCQKTASMSLMFGVYEEVRRPLFEAKVPPYLAKTVAGMSAGCVEALLMPFERVQSLLQDRKYNSQFNNMHHAFKVILKNYGIRECYRGFTPVIMRNGPSNAMYFILLDEAQDLFSHRVSWLGQLMQEFVAGACIGAVISTCFYPVNVLKVHLQTRLGGPFENAFKVFMELCTENGWRSIYRGVHLNYTRAFISWGVITASYDFLHRMLY